jgi:hypothetical protein
LDKAFCEASSAGEYHDAGRINLLQALIAQAAHVWHDADMHFKPFVESAERRISQLDSDLDRNAAAQGVLKVKMNVDLENIVERILKDARTKQIVAAGKLDRLVQEYAGKLGRDAHANIASLVNKKFEEAVLVEKIQKYKTFIAFAQYRPTFRESWNYRVDRMQDAVYRWRLFMRLSTSQRAFVTISFDQIRNHGQPKNGVDTSIQRRASLLN